MLFLANSQPARPQTGPSSIRYSKSMWTLLVQRSNLCSFSCGNSCKKLLLNRSRGCCHCLLAFLKGYQLGIGKACLHCNMEGLHLRAVGCHQPFHLFLQLLYCVFRSSLFMQRRIRLSPCTQTSLSASRLPFPITATLSLLCLSGERACMWVSPCAGVCMCVRYTVEGGWVRG